jgi:NTP pyrophosphatase (non-canonical NTP hydrolase)
MPRSNTDKLRIMTHLVYFTGLQALQDPDHRKWFLIWAAGVVTETYEVEHEKRKLIDNLWDPCEMLAEIGDVLWHVVALRELFHLKEDIFYTADVVNPCNNEFRFKLLEIAKKCSRDGEARPYPLDEIKLCINRMLTDLLNYPHIDKAIDLVDQKLRTRYPNGFNAQDSVNRVV